MSRFTLASSLMLPILSATTAVAQEPAQPAQPERPSPLVWLVLLVPFLVWLVFVFSSTRRARRMQPMMDRSLQIAEENIQISRQLLEAQQETNQLLRRLIATRGGSE